MNEDLITVVVPVYKTEKYLDRCVSSITGQSHTNLEIILVDDGSPDGCPALCDLWAQRDSRIRVIHKENAGLGMARNTGIENATGAYICFVDSDDFLVPAALEKALTLAKEKAVQIVAFGMLRVKANGQILQPRLPQEEPVCYRADAVQNSFLPDLIDSSCAKGPNRYLCFSAWSGLFSMALIRAAGWRFVSERELISEDSYSLLWLYQYVQSVAVLPEALYCYCENSASLTQVYRRDRYEKLKVFYGACMALAKEAGYGPEIPRRIKGLFLGFSIAAMKQIATGPLTEKERQALIREIVADETMQGVLAEVDIKGWNLARYLLFQAMKQQCNRTVYAMVKLQVIANSEKR